MKNLCKRWLLLFIGVIAATGQLGAFTRDDAARPLAIKAPNGMYLMEKGDLEVSQEWPDQIVAAYSGDPKDGIGAQFVLIVGQNPQGQEVYGFISSKSGNTVQGDWFKKHIRAGNKNFLEWEQMNIVDGKYIQTQWGEYFGFPDSDNRVLRLVPNKSQAAPFEFIFLDDRQELEEIQEPGEPKLLPEEAVLPGPKEPEEFIQSSMGVHQSSMEDHTVPGVLSEGNIVAIKAPNGKYFYVGSAGQLVEWPDSVNATLDGEIDSATLSTFPAALFKVLHAADDETIIGFEAQGGRTIAAIPSWGGASAAPWTVTRWKTAFQNKEEVWERFRVVDGKYLQSVASGAYITLPFINSENVVERDRVRTHNPVEKPDRWREATKSEAAQLEFVLVREPATILPPEWNHEEADAQSITVGSRNGKLEVWMVDSQGDLFGYDQNSQDANAWTKTINEKDADGNDLKFEKVTMSDDGQLYVLSDSKVYRYNFNKNYFVQLPAGQDNQAVIIENIAVGNKETLVANDFDNNLYKYDFDANSWQLLNMAGEEIAASLDGTIVIISSGLVLAMLPGSDSFTEMPNFEAKQIAVADKDTIYALSLMGHVHQWNAEQQRWIPIGAEGIEGLAANAAGTIFAFSPSGHTFNNKEDAVEAAETVVDGKKVKKAKKVKAKQTRKDKKKKKLLSTKKRKKQRKPKKKLKKRTMKQVRKQKEAAKKKQVKKKKAAKKKTITKKTKKAQKKAKATKKAKAKTAQKKVKKVTKKKVKKAKTKKKAPKKKSVKKKKAKKKAKKKKDTLENVASEVVAEVID